MFKATMYFNNNFCFFNLDLWLRFNLLYQLLLAFAPSACDFRLRYIIVMTLTAFVIVIVWYQFITFAHCIILILYTYIQ